MNCFHRSHFPFVFGTRECSDFTCVRHVDEKKFFPFRELRHFPMCFPEITEYRTVNRTDIPYRPLSTPVKPVYRHKPPALFNRHPELNTSVIRCGLAVRRYAGKQKDLGSIRFRPPFSSKIVVYGHCLVTLPTQINETLKCLTQLPTL